MALSLSLLLDVALLFNIAHHRVQKAPQKSWNCILDYGHNSRWGRPVKRPVVALPQQWVAHFFGSRWDDLVQHVFHQIRSRVAYQPRPPSCGPSSKPTVMISTGRPVDLPGILSCPWGCQQTQCFPNNYSKGDKKNKHPNHLNTAVLNPFLPISEPLVP